MTADGLAQLMDGNGFIKTMVGELSKAGFAVASSEIHAIPGAFSFACAATCTRFASTRE